MLTSIAPETDGVVLVGEDACEILVGPDLAFEAVSDVFAAMARGDARNFPVVREALGYADALYGFKSGFDSNGQVLGVKAGGYWPRNTERGMTNHQSTILLFDPDTGQLSGLVAGNYLTAIRTAASSSVSIAHLARADAKVLGMVGAGHQASFQLRAAVRQRRFEKIMCWNPHAEMIPKLGAVADELGIAFESVSQQELAAGSDVIITITSAFEPLLMRDWISPGTHIACMGTDTKGKQEVDADLVAASTLFTDEVAQSILIGEAQHAFARGLITQDAIAPIGAVINGTDPGRTSDQQITLFDGTGVGLQDLAVASVAAKAAKQQGLARHVSL